MGKKLAIKGHPTRGREVIELLEMIGRINPFSNINKGVVAGNIVNRYYYTFKSDATIYISWNYIDSKEIDKYKIFTLEEFLEKFPFKVGDAIRFPNDTDTLEEIAEMEWDEELEDIIYTSVSGWTRPCSVPKNTNNETNVKTDCKKCCIHYGSTQRFDKDCPNNTSKDMEENKVDLTLKVKGESYYGNRISYQIPDGYEVSKIENGKIILQKKKPKYPTTYEECCEVFGLNHYLGISWNSYDEYSGVITCLPKQIDDIAKKLESLSKLIICRNAYWKIYGEEMGLDGPWKPDWQGEGCYVIVNHRGDIVTDVQWHANAILAFPTEEMRDFFFEHFKKDIEQCKEFL